MRLTEVCHQLLLLGRLLSEELNEKICTFLMLVSEGVMSERKSLHPIHFSKLSRKEILVAARLSWFRFVSISRISLLRVR